MLNMSRAVGNRRQTVTIEAMVVATTDKAIKLYGPPLGLIEDPWIPRSQILDCDDDLDEAAEGDEITIEIPLWLARDKALVEQ